MDPKIKNFFYPKSICIAGASSKEKNIGYEILRSIKEFNFTGKVFPVNPKSENILGFKCFKSITEIPEKIDLAIIVVPKQFVENSIDELIRKNVKSIILITAGFKETGEEGKIREDAILKKVKDNDIRLIGPNCMGIINSLESIRLNATFVAEKPENGSTAFLSQSGALGAAVLNSLRVTNIKFAHFISVGNKADISENDILQFWLDDNNIKVITMYLESFENGLEFLNIINSSENKKPIIIIKAGKTNSGMKAASSHTGALSSNDKIVDSLLNQFGIIRTNDLNELFNTAKGFENFPIPKGRNIAVVTNAGGPAILAVDKIEEENLNLAQISEITKSKLKEIVHPEGSINNPIDLLPGATSDIYKKVNEIILHDENVDAVISIFVEPVMVNAFDVIESVNSIISDKPIYQVCMPLPEFWEKYKSESKYRLPIFRKPEDPAEIISNILLFEEKKKNKINFIWERNNFKNNSIKKRFIDQNQTFELCRKYDIPIAEQILLSEIEIQNIEINFPIVVKGISDKAIHKSELNAVKLNIKNYGELKTAADEIKSSFMINNLEVQKFLIQPYIKSKHEILVGGFRDNSFGPIIMFGLGGKYVEVFEDTQIRSAYLTNNDLSEIVEKTKIGKILKGVRGENSIDLEKLKNIISSSAKMLIENENIIEFDLNPIIVDERNNLFAVDARIACMD
ncbi:MAG: acetate--CoA ligase family protein [Ignavibacteriae bacterium]|nr:acetate--CoA ligase family protein [Ignavibacteriota bacterium]